MQKILSLMRHAIDKYNLIKDGDKIAVGISGGKDSLILAKALKQYSKFSKEKFSIVGITIDMFNNDKFMTTKPGQRTVPLGHVKQGQFIVVAIPVIFDLIAVKDDGFGNYMEFDESVLGVNGVDVKLGDNILTRVTCSNDFENSRWVVMAREVREGESHVVDTSQAVIRKNPLYPQKWYDKRGIKKKVSSN